MSSSGAYNRHDAAGKHVKEDLLDVMAVLDVRDDNPLVKDLAQVKANGVYHEWTYFERARSTGGNAAVEGADYTYSTLTSPTRAINYVESIEETYKITRIMALENTVGGDEGKRRKEDALRNLMAKMEFEGIFASGVSGASNTARYMKGILSLLSKATNASNATLTEVNFKKYIKEVWRERNVDTLMAFMDADLMDIVDSFTAGSTKNIDAKDKRLINYINVLETGYGTVELYKHRDLGSSKRLFFIDRDQFRWAFYDRPNHYSIPAIGSWEAGVYRTSVTMEALDPKAGISVQNA